MRNYSNKQTGGRNWTEDDKKICAIMTGFEYDTDFLMWIDYCGGGTYHDLEGFVGNMENFLWSAKNSGRKGKDIIYDDNDITVPVSRLLKRITNRWGDSAKKSIAFTRLGNWTSGHRHKEANLLNMAGNEYRQENLENKTRNDTMYGGFTGSSESLVDQSNPVADLVTGTTVSPGNAIPLDKMPVANWKPGNNGFRNWGTFFDLVFDSSGATNMNDCELNMATASGGGSDVMPVLTLLICPLLSGINNINEDVGGSKVVSTIGVIIENNIGTQVAGSKYYLRVWFNILLNGRALPVSGVKYKNLKGLTTSPADIAKLFLTGPSLAKFTDVEPGDKVELPDLMHVHRDDWVVDDPAKRTYKNKVTGETWSPEDYWKSDGKTKKCGPFYAQGLFGKTECRNMLNCIVENGWSFECEGLFEQGTKLDKDTREHLKNIEMPAIIETMLRLDWQMVQGINGEWNAMSVDGMLPRMKKRLNIEQSAYDKLKANNAFREFFGIMVEKMNTEAWHFMNPGRTKNDNVTREWKGNLGVFGVKALQPSMVIGANDVNSIIRQQRLWQASERPPLQGGGNSTLTMDDDANVFYNGIPVLLGGGMESRYYVDRESNGSTYLRNQFKKAIDNLESQGKKLSSKSYYNLQQNINRMEQYENYLERILTMMTSYKKYVSRHPGLEGEITLKQMQELTNDWDKLQNKRNNKNEQILSQINAVYRAGNIFDVPIVTVVKGPDKPEVRSIQSLM